MGKEVIADSSTLIFLAKLQRLDLLKNLFSVVSAPQKVLEEIFQKDAPENSLLRKEIDSFIYGRTVREIQSFPLDEGERAAISLCLERKIIVLLSDDKKARIFAQSLGIEVIGVLGVLSINVNKSLLKKEECRLLLEILMQQGYYLASELHMQFLQDLEEM